MKTLHVSTALRDFQIEAQDRAHARMRVAMLLVEGELGESFRVAEIAPSVNEEEALTEFWTSVEDEDCVDNFRMAYADDADAVAGYEQQRDEGCCGSTDQVYSVNGRILFLGCNYGH